jgi:hypothetical protein
MIPRAMLIAAAAFGALSLTPSITHAQAVRSEVSSNRETQRLHDSLAVHFLRHPAAKPGIDFSRHKDKTQAPRPVTSTTARTPETPLPQRRSKQRR